MFAAPQHLKAKANPARGTNYTELYYPAHDSIEVQLDTPIIDWVKEPHSATHFIRDKAPLQHVVRKY